MLTSADTQRGVLCVDSLLVIFDLLGRNVEGKMVANEASDTANLNGSEFPLSYVRCPNAVPSRDAYRLA